MQRADDRSLSLFDGEHLASRRLEQALEALDLAAAAAVAAQPWPRVIGQLAAAVGEGSPGRAELEALLAAHESDWPDWLERLWQRLVGLRLDGRGFPGVLDGQPAAAFLLRGGERDRGIQSLSRHLQRHPTDAVAWRIRAELGDRVAAVRCAWHGGRLLLAVRDLVDLVEVDEQEEVAAWLLPYAWLSRWIDSAELRAALSAEGLLDALPMAIPGDARAVARYMLWAEEHRLAGGGPTTTAVHDRRRMKRISPVAFQRYLATLR